MHSSSGVLGGDQAGAGTVEGFVAALIFVGLGLNNVLLQGNRKNRRMVDAIAYAPFLAHQPDNAVGYFEVLYGLP